DALPIMHTHYMHNQIFDRNRLTEFNSCQIGICDFVSVHQNHKPGTNGFHTNPIFNKQPSIFTQAYSQHPRVCHHRLKKSSGSASLHKMRIDNYVINKPKATSDFNFPFQQSFLDRKSTRLNSSHVKISYAVFCLKKKTTLQQ